MTAIVLWQLVGYVYIVLIQNALPAITLMTLWQMVHFSAGKLSAPVRCASKVHQVLVRACCINTIQMNYMTLMLYKFLKNYKINTDWVSISYEMFIFLSYQCFDS